MNLSNASPKKMDLNQNVKQGHNQMEIRIVPIVSKHMKSIHKILQESFGTKRFLGIFPATESYDELCQKYDEMPLRKKQLGSVAVMINPKNRNDVIGSTKDPTNNDNTSQNNEKHNDNNAAKGESVNDDVVDDDDHVVVGYVQMTMEGLPLFLEGFHECSSDEMYIEMIGVSSVARGCGIGQKLLHWCVQQSILNQKSMLRLDVLNGNRAIHLYERFGFVISEYETDCYSSCIVCIMFGCPYGLCHTKLGSLKMEMNVSNYVQERIPQHIDSSKGAEPVLSQFSPSEDVMKG